MQTLVITLPCPADGRAIADAANALVGRRIASRPGVVVGAILSLAVAAADLVVVVSLVTPGEAASAPAPPKPAPAAPATHTRGALADAQDAAAAMAATGATATDWADLTQVHPAPVAAASVRFGPLSGGMTDKQRRAIYAIGKAVRGWTEGQVDSLCQSRLGCAVAALDKAGASALIDLLKGDQAA